MADATKDAKPRTALARALRGAWRLFTLRRADPGDFEPSPDLFALLVALDFVLLFAFAFVLVGVKGELNLYELPRAFMFVPLALVVGLVATKIDRATPLLRLPVAFASAGLYFTVLTSGMYLLAQRQWLPFTETYWSYFDYLSLAWSAAVVVLGAMTLTSGAAQARAGLGAAGIVLLVLPSLWLPLGLIWMPRYDDRTSYATGTFHSLAAESSFYAQHGALERVLAEVQPGRPGVTDLYLVAAGLYAGEDVFMKEVRMLSTLFRERFDADGRTVVLMNNPKTIQEFPIASVTSLRETLVHLGGTMNPEEDVLVLYLTSHGSESHELSVDFRPLRLAPVTPDTVKAALDEAGIRWRVVIVSACYSGGFVEPLKDERSMVITAAAADRKSFGCGNLSEATYLAQALFGQALKETRSFERAFETARATIEKWEAEKNQEPSRPQVFVGARMRDKLAELERRLSSPPRAAK